MYRIMKTILMFFVLFIAIPMDMQAQKTVTIQEGPTLAEMERFYSETQLPFLATRKKLTGNSEESVYGHIAAFPRDKMQGLNVFVWEDLQCTKNQKFRQLFAWLILKKPVSDRVVLKDIDIYAGGVLNRHLLATYDDSGNVIDQLEGAIYGDNAHGVKLWVKQFRIDPDMKVTVYELKVDPVAPINFGDDFQSVRAQRVDTQYRIDSTGQFEKLYEKHYRPQNYTMEQMSDPDVNIWDGTENVMR